MLHASLSQPPTRYKKAPKLKGSRAKGLTYERAVGRRLIRRIDAGDLRAELVSNQWFRFVDKNGKGFCQTDHYLICGDFIILIECKLTQNKFAKNQMLKLYKPVLEHIYEVPIICVQVFKNVRAKMTNRIADISDLMTNPVPNIYSWHYIP